MNLPMCVRCKKRPAAVFITKNENGNTTNEGLCFVCAHEMGIKPLDNMLKQMGMSEETIESMSGELEDAMAEVSENMLDVPEQDDGGAPAIDLNKFFSGLGFGPMNPSAMNNKGTKKEKTKKEEIPKEKERKFLSMYCTSLTNKASEGKIDRIVGRDRELERVIQILCRRQKNNPCLIGEPGVGKTAIAEALAQRIIDKNVPEKLVDSEVWLLDLTALVAGTQFRGQFESRILGLIKEVKTAGNIILVIDEVHNIVGAGDSEGSMSAANMLKPALSRGEIQVIGATTLKEYRKYIEKDSALERRFQPVMVNEPSIDETVEVIKGIKGYYERYHGIAITNEVARAAVTLSERYITDRFLPDKAIDLIDEAASRAALSSPEINENNRNIKAITELNAKKSELEALLEKPDGQTEENYKNLADLKVQLLRLEERQKEIAEIISGLKLSVNDLANVVEIWTGIPASDIKEGEMGELIGLKERISAQLIGQEEAVDAVVRAVKRKRTGISYRRNPVSMIFAGPTGVGKTELVKVLSAELFKQPEALIRLDMSEFMEKFAVSRIIGAPPGYVGYDEAGQLTEKIRRRPYSVVLFDEIEKAHPDVLNILLQILDDGKITDAQGRVVNFENTIIIMTTNAGSEKASSISGFSENREVMAKEKTEKALFGFLRPEFINRIDEIITFSHLTKENFEAIARIMLSKLTESMDDKGIRLTYTDALISYIADKSFSEKFGARNMRRFIERNVEDLIATTIVDSYPEKIIGAHLDVDNDKVTIKTI
ncbi:MAG: ATP-dependent Clp protease ATP-binding subunit [Ruminococcaceae bacterium]|nr:ATP-dependent Clp protease ATP-binding subunit [Oscillospiraceae bacterium]